MKKISVIFILLLYILPVYSQEYSRLDIEDLGEFAIKQRESCNTSGTLEMTIDTLKINNKPLAIKKIKEDYYKSLKGNIYINLYREEGKVIRVYIRKNRKVYIYYLTN